MLQRNQILSWVSKKGRTIFELFNKLFPFLVLTTFVEGVGRKGDVVSVRPNVGYNKLLLPGLATYKTEENIKKYARTQEEDEVEKHSSPFAQRASFIHSQYINSNC